MMAVEQTSKYDLSTFIRRRSTHIYHSIILESDEDDKTESNQSDEQHDTVAVASSPGPGQWKIFIITNSVTNYFCCGCNITRGIAKVKNLSPIAWTVNKLGGEEIAGIKKKFVSSLSDWILDLSTTISHLLNFGAVGWSDAALTYLIVLICGLISTFGFLRYREIRLTMKRKAKNVGFIWSMLLYIPTFFTVVSTRLWLSSASELEFLTIHAHPEIRNKNTDRVSELEKLTTNLKEWTLKALWLETVVEAKPQAVIQTMLIVEKSLTAANNTVLDFSPVLLSLWSMYTVTNSIYDMVVLNYVDRTGIFAKLYGNSYTAVSTLAPALLISVSRKIVASRGEEFQLFLLTIASLGLYYLVFEIIYQMTYMICTFLSRNGTPIQKHTTFVKIYTPVLVLIFSLCASVWGYVNQDTSGDTNIMLKIYIVIGIFVTFLLINVLSCFKAFGFVEECFRLKNVKIDEAWVKFKSNSEK